MTQLGLIHGTMIFIKKKITGFVPPDQAIDMGMTPDTHDNYIYRKNVPANTQGTIEGILSPDYAQVVFELFSARHHMITVSAKVRITNIALVDVAHEEKEAKEEKKTDEDKEKEKKSLQEELR